MSDLMRLYGVAQGFIGENWPDMCDAVGIGSVSHLAGKAFATADTGLTPGTGNGVGTGLTGVVKTTLSSALFAALLAGFGSSGDNLQDLCDAVAEALVGEIGVASLASTHAPVYQGSGIVTPGSIPVVGSAWGDLIETQGLGLGFAGINWPVFASIVGTQMASAMATATGNVTITGTFTGPTPPGPVPGVGVGVGTIS